MACVKKRRGKWVVDWRDVQGRRHWETKPDKKSANERLSEVLKNQGVTLTTDDRTGKEYGEWWLDKIARPTIKGSTYQEYEIVLRKHVYPTLGNHQFSKVTRPMIRDLVAAKKDEGYEQSTIRNIMAPLRGMFFQAIEDGITEKNPAGRIGKHNKQSKDKPRKKIDPLAREEIQVLLQTALAKRPAWYPLFLCACRTGLRMGELIALRGTDIDFNNRFVHVQRNLSRGRISATKNGKDRKVDMSNMLAGVLSELLSARRSNALQEELKKPAEERRDRDTVINCVFRTKSATCSGANQPINQVMEDWLFQTPIIERSDLAKRRRPDIEARGGTQLDPSNLRKVFNRLLSDAKLRRVRFHDLRHSFASLLLQNGESLAYVKEQMGHSSINVTVDIYGHLVPGGNRAAVDKLDMQVSKTAEQASEAAR
jgi:integrase